MKLQKLMKVKDGKYLKNYELTYLNKKGNEKIYEIVSRKELKDESDLGQQISGISIIAYKDEKMLLLKEFRMGINKKIYNLCSGMIDTNETIEQCVKRELYEETGLQLKNIIKILKPSYSAVAITDTKTHLVFIEATGNFEDNTSDNEEIEANFYTKDEIKVMLETEEFSSRAQLAAYQFAYS